MFNPLPSLRTNGVMGCGQGGCAWDGLGLFCVGGVGFGPVGEGLPVPGCQGLFLGAGPTLDLPFAG